MKLSDAQTATIRTTVNAAVMAAVTWIFANVLSWDVHLDNPIVIAIIAVATTVVYSASIWVVNRWPIVGRLLFGIGKPPSYTEESEPSP
jgi:hypothetical protein